MRRYKNDILCILLMTGLVIIYFFRLFYPIPQLIVTPDFGRSDAWHFSFATKYALSQSLNAGQLPLWRSDIGDGFPLLAEGQTGTYFLPNLILFSLLPPVIAYNLALALSILTLAFGIYLVTRFYNMSPLTSLFAAVNFSFSGLPILQLTHITLLQGMSFLPLILACTIFLFRFGAFPWMALLALCITQQFFAGFPQASFLTMILSGAFACWTTYSEKKYTPFIWFCVACLFGLIGASAQILPSWEFLRASTNPSGFNFSSAAQYSMPLKHLVTFLNPFSLGNPKFGTYPPFNQFDGSIFWENTAYIGLLPLLCIIVSWIYRRLPPTLFFWAFLFGSLLMAWGKNSPVYLLFTMWPFNLFRVPSRFLWLAVFSGVFLAASGFESLKPKKILRAAILLVTLLDLFLFSWNYHMIIPAKQLLVQPAERIEGKIHTSGLNEAHNAFYIPSGWHNPTPYIKLYKEAYAPLANILYGVNQHDIYAGRFLYRSMIADGFLTQEKSADIMKNILGIRTIISYEKTRHVEENPYAVPRAYLVRVATTAATLNEAFARITDPSFTAGKTALLETRDVNANPKLKQFLNTDISSVSLPVTMHRDNQTDILMTVDVRESAALLVLTDTYYPGWVAQVDGSETPIYPSNIKQRAIVVPKGTHIVHFLYHPRSVSLGLMITIVTEFLVVLLTVVPFGGLIVDIGKKARPNGLHHGNSRDR